MVLSHSEFDLLWDDLIGWTPPYPLEVASHGATMAERDELGAKVFAALGNAGLADGEEVAPGLRGLVELLDRPVRHSGRLEAHGRGQAAANSPAGRSSIVNWYDTATGRYAVTMEAVGNELLATLVPADGAWISRRDPGTPSGGMVVT